MAAIAMNFGSAGLLRPEPSPWNTTMTGDTWARRDLMKKVSDASLLREIIGFPAQRLMKHETEPLCGAAHGERSTERMNQRNG